MTISPDGPTEAGKVGTWTLTYTVGAAGIATGGGLRIMPPVTIVGEHYNMVRWQLNYVSATGPVGSDMAASILLLNEGRYDGAFAYIVDVKNHGRALECGKTVAIELKHAVASRFAMRLARFEVEVDTTGEQKYSCVEHERPRDETNAIIERSRLPNPPTIDVLPAPATALRLAAQGTGRLILSARDAFGNRASQFRGPVVFSAGGEALGLPETYGLAEEDRGAHTFAMASPGTDHVVRVHAKVSDRPIECVSSPIAAGFPKPVFFGDMHCHHNLSRGPEGAAVLYEHARDFAGLDFVAMTDYDANKIPCREVTREYDEPGRFVALFAEEWADKASADHRNVYYRGDPGDSACRAGNSLSLFDQFRGQDVLIVPHTPDIDCLVGWKHTDWSQHDPELQRLMEICQIRGDCEKEGLTGARPKGGHGSSARSALARGLKVGFVGGSDTHRGTPGGPGHRLHPLAETTGPPRWGQTGVLANELTREAIFDALRERRCYATTGTRALLWFALNGQPMGAELRTDDSAQIEIRFHAEAPVVELLIVRNGTEWRRFEPNGLDGELALTDETVPVGANYYYVRLTQSDGHRAWSSPVWLDRA